MDRRFDRLTATLGGYELTQMLSVFARLEIPEVLARGPASADEIARELDLHAPSLHRLLRALSSTRVVARDEEGRFVLTSAGARLRRDDPDSVYGLAVGFGQSWWWNAWGALIHTVRTGETAFDAVHGRSLYDYLEDDPDASAAFAECIALRAADDPAAVAEAFDFSTVRTVVDVGGGNGDLVETLLERNPALRAVLFDQPATIAAARKHLHGSPAADRIELVEGDFFTAVPAGGDVYVLKNVLHNWDDEEARLILTRVREALPDTGRVLVVQHLVPETDEPSPAKLLDIALLVLSGGKQRTLAEYDALLGDAGLALLNVVVSSTGTSVVEARASV